MKRYFLTFLIAGAIALSVLPVVSAETESKVIVYPDRTVIIESDGSIITEYADKTIFDRGDVVVTNYYGGRLIVCENAPDFNGTVVTVCANYTTNKLLGEWVADGLIPLETVVLRDCGGSCLCWHEERKDISYRISDLSPLSQLLNLREVMLLNHNISDLSPLYGLVNIERLWLLVTLLPTLRH
jgi:hypothetical protein